MGTSIGAAIDYLVAGLPARLALIEPMVIVADNWPDKESRSFVVIGHTSPDSGAAADGEDQYLELGALRVEESYSIACYVDVIRNGPAQKPARDAAIALFDGVVAFVHADMTLGGLITRGRFAMASKVQLSQTQDVTDTGEAGLLRRAVISFEIAVHNSYIP